MNQNSSPMLPLLLTAFVITGCTTVRDTFPDRTPTEVWIALQAVAETPDYYSKERDPDMRWFVKENEVAVFNETSRIEIYRELQRVLHRARTNPITEHRTWRFQVTLEPSETPKVTFVSRGFGVPARARIEGQRYFADVRRLLEYPVSEGEAPPAPPAPPASDPTAQDQLPPDGEQVEFEGVEPE